MREVIPLYKSVYKGIKNLDAETFKRMMLALMEYGFEDEEPELSGLELTAFESWKANIDARSKDSDNGKKGGRPSKNPGYETKNPPFVDKNPGYETKNPPFVDKNPGYESEKHIIETKTETETETKTKTDTEQKHRRGPFGHVLLTEKEGAKLAEDYGEDQAKAAIDYLDEHIERKGYTAKSHYLAIRKWVFDAMREEKIKQQELSQREQRLKGKPPNGIRELKAGITRGTDFDSQVLDQMFAGTGGGHAN